MWEFRPMGYFGRSKAAQSRTRFRPDSCLRSSGEPLVSRSGNTTRLTFLALFCQVFFGLLSSSTFGAQLGAAKFDLLLQYTNPRGPSGKAAEGQSLVRHAEALKAIADARDAGFPFLRVSISGYHPVEFDDPQNDLALWRTDPAAFWAAADRMFDDLDQANVRIVPTLIWDIAQFPVIGNDQISTFVRNPNSTSRKLAMQFVREFVTRYKGRKTILFYELTNEMNNHVDVQTQKKCNKVKSGPCVWDNFTTPEMLEFSRDMVSLIKSIDAKTPISSGYSIPRPAAAHLATQPNAGRFTRDTQEEFKNQLIAIHAPFDIISVHIYPTPENDRFGRPPGEQYKMAEDAEAAARIAGKPLFIGEFGDTGPSTFMTNILNEITHDGIDFASVWVWEVDHNSGYQPATAKAARRNIDPSVSGPLIDLLMSSEREIGRSPMASTTPALPHVVLTWPVPCDSVNGPVDLWSVASDHAHAVKSVQFLVDGKPLAIVSAAPYSTHFDPSGWGARAVTIEARATGASGAVSTFASNVGLNGAGASTSCGDAR